MGSLPSHGENGRILSEGTYMEWVDDEVRDYLSRAKALMVITENPREFGLVAGP
jgi:hypothetical protein